MKRVNEMLAVVILSLLAVLTAAVGLRLYDTYVVNRETKADVKRQEEVLSRNREAHDRVLEMRREIEELSQDRERLGQFLEEIQTGTAEAVPVLAVYDADRDGTAGGMAESLSEDDMAWEQTSLSENDTAPESTSLSENGTVSENTSLSENGTVSENTSLSGNDTVSGNTSLSENDTVSGNTSLSGNDTISDNTSLSGNAAVSGNTQSFLPGLVSPEVTLEERRQLRSSFEDTLLVNEEDRVYLENRQTDFSGKKIACLGDSITAAANLEKEEGYLSYAYPAVLKDLLGAEEVYNLGVGGSSIGRYWADAFVDRYTQIPSDTDIIIVMGGTNDGFCLSQGEFGTLAERKPWTFCGDLDELMRGLKESYPDAEIFFATPLPNILQDYLMRERTYLLPQKNLADVILTLAAEYDFEVIDLYNSNILDSHDADIVARYMPDGVHGNREGYRILAEHIAAEVSRSYE